MATMTLIGLYNYRPDLFELLTLPAGIDKDILVDNILVRASDFEVLYSDPDFVHDSLRIWSAKWYRTFTRWQKALEIDYDPLYNYDRREEWTDVGSGEEKRSADGMSKVVGTVKDKTDTTTENTVSAYNSGTYQPDNKTTTGGTSESNIDNTNTSQNRETLDKSNTNKRTGRAYGNIGVTTSQQMLEAELSVAEWNLYDHITDIFLSEYVIPVFD